MIFGIEFRWERPLSLHFTSAHVMLNNQPRVLQYRVKVAPIYAGADGNVHVAVSDPPEWTEWKEVEINP